MEMKTTWDFVQRYYPDYDHCEDIAENDDLVKIVDDEWEEGDCASKIYEDIAEDFKGLFPYHTPEEREEYRDMIRVEAQRRLNKSYVNIYKRAIEGFIEENISSKED